MMRYLFKHLTEKLFPLFIIFINRCWSRVPLNVYHCTNSLNTLGLFRMPSPPAYTGASVPHNLFLYLLEKLRKCFYIIKFVKNKINAK